MFREVVKMVRIGVDCGSRGNRTNEDAAWTEERHQVFDEGLRVRDMFDGFQ